MLRNGNPFKNLDGKWNGRENSILLGRPRSRFPRIV